jgi:hypothetical protein
MSKYFFGILFIALMASCSKERRVVVVSITDYKIDGFEGKPKKHTYVAPYNKDEYDWTEASLKIADKEYKIEDEVGSFVVNNSPNDLIITSLDAPVDKTKERLSQIASATSIERVFQEIQLDNTGQEAVKEIERIPAFTVKKVANKNATRIYGPQSQPPRKIDIAEGEERPLLFQMFDLPEIKKNFKKELPQ